jgi:hypothetical protein
MESFATGAKKAFVLTDKGYIVEAQFDLTTICPNVKMQSGTVIGLDVQVNDQAKGETIRTGAYGWSDDSNLAWQTTTVLGEITFIAAPAPATTEGDSKNPGTNDSADLALLSIAIVCLSFISIIFVKRKNSI